MYPDYDKIVSKQRISADKENTELHVPAERKVSIMKKRILIVEDDVTIQAQLKTLLTGNGYETAVVTDFSKTIEQVKTLNPHLVLLDIRLPGNSGFEICSQIRAFSDMPIVFVTSSTTDMDELNSIMLAGTLFFQSPITRRSCLPKLPHCCGGHMLPGRQKYLPGTEPPCIWKAVRSNTGDRKRN